MQFDWARHVLNDQWICIHANDFLHSCLIILDDWFSDRAERWEISISWCYPSGRNEENQISTLTYPSRCVLSGPKEQPWMHVDIRISTQIRSSVLCILRARGRHSTELLKQCQTNGRRCWRRLPAIHWIRWCIYTVFFSLHNYNYCCDLRHLSMYFLVCSDVYFHVSWILWRNYELAWQHDENSQ